MQLNGLNSSCDAVEGDLTKLNCGFSQSLAEIGRMEQEHRGDLERISGKMRGVEETLNKRNEK